MPGKVILMQALHDHDDGTFFLVVATIAIGEKSLVTSKATVAKS
jgi:hypothetical protein